MPQGTLLGPKCFLAYINDLHTPCAFYKYVDDTTILEVCHRNEVSVIQESIDIATQWITENDMKINCASIEGKDSITTRTFIQHNLAQRRESVDPTGSRNRNIIQYMAWPLSFLLY